MINIGQSNNKTIALDLPILTETRLLVQAMSGAGKSWLLRRLLEQSHGQIQQIVLDIEGEFHTLREKFEYIIAGKGGDIPVNPKSAGLLARKLLEFNASCICDLYELKAHERIAFIRYFLEALISAPRSMRHPVLVILDEAHIACPERGQVESAPAVIDLATRGRKRGLCAIMATQRLSKLHKDASAELSNKLIGRTIQDIDRKRAVDELGFTSREESLSLRKLQPGQFHCYGPAFHIHEGSLGYQQVDDIVLVDVGDVQSTHPRVGSRHIETTPEATGKIKELITKFQDIPREIEREVNDLAAFKKENAELKKQFALFEKGAAPRCDHEPLIRDLQMEINSLRDKLKKMGDQLCGRLKTVNLAITKSRNDFDSLLRVTERPDDLMSEIHKLISNHNPIILRPRNLPILSNARVLPERTILQNPKTPKFPNPHIDETDVSNPQRKVLGIIASLGVLGVDEPTKEIVAALSHYSPKGGAYNNLLGRLRTNGYINYPTAGKVILTESGLALAGDVPPISGVEELHAGWLEVIKLVPLQNILKHLIKIYPDSISREALAAEFEYSCNGGAFNNYLGRLHNTFEVIDYLPGKMIRARQEVLFPEGIA